MRDVLITAVCGLVVLSLYISYQASGLKEMAYQSQEPDSPAFPVYAQASRERDYYKGLPVGRWHAKIANLGVDGDINLQIDKSGDFHLSMIINKFGMTLFDESVQGKFALIGSVLEGTDIQGAIGLLSEGRYLVVERNDGNELVLKNTDMSTMTLYRLSEST